MSKEIDELRRKLKNQFGGDSDSVFSGVVTKVNETEFTCTIQRDEQVDYFDVRLRGLVNADLHGFAFIPKIESVVLVCRIGRSNELFVCQFTEIDKVLLTMSDKHSLEITADSAVVMNDKSVVSVKADQTEIKVGESVVKVTDKGLTLVKGSFGLLKTLEALCDAITKLTVSTAVGASTPPINLADFVKIKTELKNYMEG